VRGKKEAPDLEIRGLRPKEIEKGNKKRRKPDNSQNTFNKAKGCRHFAVTMATTILKERSEGTQRLRANHLWGLAPSCFSDTVRRRGVRKWGGRALEPSARGGGFSKVDRSRQKPSCEKRGSAHPRAYRNTGGTDGNRTRGKNCSLDYTRTSTGKKGRDRIGLFDHARRLRKKSSGQDGESFDSASGVNRRKKYSSVL